MNEDLLRKLEERLGPLHARQRLGIERDCEAQVFGQGLTFFHLENWLSAPAVIRTALKLTGLYWHARRNAERVVKLSRKDLRSVRGDLGCPCQNTQRAHAILHQANVLRHEKAKQFFCTNFSLVDVG
jgi:hypothetical protein